MSTFHDHEQIPTAYEFSPSSFKKTIIKRIIASIRYYLSILDAEKAEAGLITVLRIVGYLSSDIIGVPFCNFRLSIHFLGIFFIFED